MSCEVSDTALRGLKAITPGVLEDERGLLVETEKREGLEDAGIDVGVMQDNPRLETNVLRGLGYQMIATLLGENRHVSNFQ